MFGESFLWVEKYRPKTIEECILPDRIKTLFQQISLEGRIPNMILSGGPGMGKTTVAKALCNEVGCDFLMINGSSRDSCISTPMPGRSGNLNPPSAYFHPVSEALSSLSDRPP